MSPPTNSPPLTDPCHMANPALHLPKASTTLRKTLRRKRLQLSKRQRFLAAYQAQRQLSHLCCRALRQKNRKVGLFVDAFGEMPTQPLIDWAYRHGHHVYLPVVRGVNQPLVFVRFIPHRLLSARLARHRLGMRQPATGAYINARELDVIVMPLVAVDAQGNRMGMGGGFYDRTLAKTKQKPLKIGWAYDFQQVTALDSKPWDVKLDAAVLPSQRLIFRRYTTKSSSKSPVKNPLNVVEPPL